MAIAVRALKKRYFEYPGKKAVGSIFLQLIDYWSHLPRLPRAIAIERQHIQQKRKRQRKVHMSLQI